MEIAHVQAQSESSVSLRLSEEFLAPYRQKGDPFQNLLARSTYLNKYCRGNESWTDTIRRVIEGNVAFDPGVTQQEAELLFHLFWTGQALPPGRGLWTGGVEGIPADARYNCFSAETRFWANGVLTSFEEAVGLTVEVLSRDGTWRPAQVRSFGRQKLYRYLLKPPFNTNFGFNFTATENHRWFTSNRGEVTDLKVGDKVLITPRTPDKTSSEYTEGFAHGFVFGDGSRETLKPGVFKLRLCGEKDWVHADALKQSRRYHNVCSPPSCKGDPILFFRSSENLKALPGDDASSDYQAGFLAGWMAADGSLRSDGSGGNRLAAQNEAALDWVVDRAPLLGYCVSGRSTDPTTETNYGVRKAPCEVLTLHAKPMEYFVRAVIDEGREEETYCVVEPETHSFTLAGGVVTGNCWWTTLRSPEDWTWAMNQLMLGGGVGVGIHEIERLPTVALGRARLAIWCGHLHPNFDEVKPNDKSFLNGSTPVFKAEDSRGGWVESLRRVLKAAYEGTDLIVDVGAVRPRGQRIKTFGGIACGPGPLAHLLRSVWAIVRTAEGRRLSSVEALDVTNLIGFCVKSGNVRRSALIVLGEAEDQEFRNAKKDTAAVYSHRHTSNNSIRFRSWDQINNFNWKGLVDDNIEFGEPGIVNMPLIWEKDPGATGINPCGEIGLHDKESCNLAEVFPAKFDGSVDTDLIFKLVTRYSLRQRMSPLEDPEADAVQRANMRVGVGLGGICDFDYTREMLTGWYKLVRSEADSYAQALGVSRPIAVTTVKPSGTISLITGSSPGIHAPYSPHYIRRTRVADNDPMTEALKDAGVPWEYDKYDQTGHTLVFEFPMKALHTRFTVQTESARDQFERQAQIQDWWSDNAVSATLSFDPETEREEMATLLESYVPRFKSTSMLAKNHSYEQAPYEAITMEEYAARVSGIDHQHPLTRGGDFEIEECTSGACPIR